MIRVTRSAVIDAPIERVWDVLRDFNSHTAWHPVVAESEIEGGEPSDQVGCVRRFTLAGRQPHPRAAPRALRPRARLDVLHPRRVAAAPPVRGHAPAQASHRRRAHVLALAVAPSMRRRVGSASWPTSSARGVYEGGFEGLRAYLRGRAGPDRARSRPARGPAAGAPMPAQGVVVPRVRRARGAAPPVALRASARARGGAHPADGGRCQLHRRLRARAACIA